MDMERPETAFALDRFTGASVIRKSENEDPQRA
jgi:hypothetical protein